MRVVRSLFAACIAVGLNAGAAAAQPKPMPTLQFIIPQLQKTPSAPPGATPTGRIITFGSGDYFWNRPPLIEALKLTEAQRKKMDAIMEAMDSKARELQRNHVELREKYDTALRERDWETARKTVKELESAFSQSWGGMFLAKIDVLSLLTEDQHQKLIAEHANVLDEPWTAARRYPDKRPLQLPSATPATPAAQ